jgi:hypothetical protein
MNLDRTKFSIVNLKESSDIGYWADKSPVERLRAIQINRQAAYGKSNASGRIQRILEVVERV